VITGVSDEDITSIFRVKNQRRKKPTCGRWLAAIALWFLARLIFGSESGSDTFSETSVHMRTARRRIPEDGNIDCHHSL
jgi:hypothetical protein